MPKRALTKQPDLTALIEDWGELRVILDKEREAVKNGDWAGLNKLAEQAKILQKRIEEARKALRFSDACSNDTEGMRLIMEECLQKNLKMRDKLDKSMEEAKEEMAILLKEKSLIKSYANPAMNRNRILDRDG